MDVQNIVVVRGSITGTPDTRALPSGAVVTAFDVTTRSGSLTAHAPVVVDGTIEPLGTGDGVLVVGHVRRRFFRSGGATQSRTEVVASAVVPLRRRRQVERQLAAVVATLSSGIDSTTGST